jgi:hypothetical protein
MRTLRLGLWRGKAALALAAAWAVLAVACGGVETGGTGSAALSAGSISGYASIVVNGIDFDESIAKVVDDSGAVLDSSVLKLGMSVRITSGAVDATQLTAKASQIEVVTDLLGPVGVNDLEHHNLRVLGQPVRVTPTTLFSADLPGGQSDIAFDEVLQIYAIFDPMGGNYVARYIAPVASASRFKLRGGLRFAGLPEGSFDSGGQIFALPPGKTRADFGLEEGPLYRLQFETVRNGLGHWVLSTAALDSPKPSEGDAIHLDDVIGVYNSQADFGIAGLRLDASQATVTPAGASVQRGDRVAVAGVYRSGKVVVQTLEIKGSAGDDFGDGTPGVFSINGAVDSLNTADKTLVIRGLTISYAGAVNFVGGTEAGLKVHVPLAVEGGRSAGNSSVIQATKIEFVSPL